MKPDRKTGYTLPAHVAAEIERLVEIHEREAEKPDPVEILAELRQRDPEPVRAEAPRDAA